MQTRKDLKRMARVVKRVLKGRKAYFAVRDLLAQRDPLGEQRYRVGVYFADSDVNIYQMRQWYAPLRTLAKTHPVLLISRDPAGARVLLEESGLDVELCQKVKSLERLIERQPLDVILYVNQNAKNFQMMRYGRRWHVFVNHGESDKMYMSSNQHKAYDVSLVAGEAARARLRRALWDFDVQTRTIPIGRPQADHLDGTPPYPDDQRTVVLYAPTWEGDRPAASYGSVLSHGEALVKRLLETGRHRVIYRPHPRSGVVWDEFGAANQRIIDMLASANRKDSEAVHIYDTEPSLTWQLSRPDIAVCDISAMVYDRLATGKPLLVTRPVSPDAEVDESGYLGECEWLVAEDAAVADRVLDDVLADESARERLDSWAVHYFGDTAPGAPTERFHSAIEELLRRADEWHERDREAERGSDTERSGLLD